MALMTFLQHLFHILWMTLKPRRRAVFTPAFLDSCNMAMGAGRASEDEKSEYNGWILQGYPGLEITFVLEQKS